MKVLLDFAYVVTYSTFVKRRHYITAWETKNSTSQISKVKQMRLKLANDATLLSLRRVSRCSSPEFLSQGPAQKEHFRTHCSISSSAFKGSRWICLWSFLPQCALQRSLPLATSLLGPGKKTRPKGKTLGTTSITEASAGSSESMLRVPALNWLLTSPRKEIRTLSPEKVLIFVTFANFKKNC